MQLVHILAQIQNDNYQIDYDRSEFGSCYAYICSIHKGLIIKMDIGRRHTDGVAWMAEINGVSVGGGAIKSSSLIEDTLDTITLIIDNSTSMLELRLVNQL